MQLDHDVTAMLKELEGGNRQLLDQIMPIIYDELHRIAVKQLRRERPNHTLRATALVNEAYLKLVDQEKVSWNNRAHFLSIAAVAMRRILVNYAKNRLAKKRGGDGVIVTFDEDIHMRQPSASELLGLDEALKSLAELNVRQSQVVEYWIFGGLSHEEIAEILHVSLGTVRRDWRMARAWLASQIKDDGLPSD